MKIGIDISQIAFPGTGSAVYTENLVKNLLKNKENEYVLFFSSLRQLPPKEFKSKNFKFPPLLLEQLWNRFHVLPIEKLIGKIDVFHTSDWLEPPAHCPKVTTIHDLIVYKYPERFQPRGGHDIVANLKRKLNWVKKESALIISVSESTKQDIVDILKIPAKKIRVIHEAPGEIYNKQQTTKNIERVKKKYQIKGDYVLMVGTREPRKNLRRAIEAFKLVNSDRWSVVREKPLITSHQSPITNHESPLTLVVVGKFGWGEDLKTTKANLLGFVPDEDLPALYSGAGAFVYPSLYEGFGLPILEAMASGCPVVTSNVSSMPEVAGKAAVLVNPEKVEDIARGIEEALESREELIKKGRARAQEFSWEKTALQTLKVYREAVSSAYQETTSVY